MNCRDYRPALVDLARGIAVDPASARAAEEHAAGCPTCAAALAGQRALTSALGVLKEDAEGLSAAVATERTLMEAFGARYGYGPQAAVRPSRRIRWMRWALPAAAGAAAAVAVLAWSGVPGGGAREPGARVAPDRVPAASADRTRLPTTVDLPAQGKDLREVPARSRAAGTPTAGQTARRPRDPLGRPAPAAIEFMAIPSAAGLPMLESARIVRVELPMAVLPEYGVAIESQAAALAVQADLLVGQDGLARGIRLVGPDRARTVRGRMQ